MEKYYFSQVNRIEKVIDLYYKNITDPKIKAVFMHLLNEFHQPNLILKKRFIINLYFDIR